MEHIFFYIGLSFMITHEMIAVRLKEWSIFPILSSLNDEKAYLIFTITHIPLYFLLFYGLYTNSIVVITGLDIFFIIHVGLHILLFKQKNNQFKSLLSWIIISFVGLFGLLDLLFGF
jgi:hypothetical protein